MSKLKAFTTVLQEAITPDDTRWSYFVANLPNPAALIENRLVKLISIFSPKDALPKIELRLVNAPSNRVTWTEPLDKFLLISVDGFRLCYPAVPPEEGFRTAPFRETSDYLARLLKTGVEINGRKYHFFGHSNSQTKSRSCFMFAASKEEISAKIEAMGDFSKMKSVAKKAKRIGLLFSSAEMGVTLPESRCQDIDDVERDGFVFTDGCGLIAEKLARFLVQKRNITYRNKRYLPSVFQIRYRGYKGVLTLDPTLQGQTAVQFRKSMKKFSDAKDLTLSLVDYAKPYAFGFLNDEIVLLLSALGISVQTLLAKQKDYIDFLQAANGGDVIAAFRLLTSRDQGDLAERLLLDGFDAVKSSTRRIVKDELSKMLNKRDEQRCRILVPQSRLIFGVSDPMAKGGNLGLIPAGSCFVRITKDGDGEARTVVNTEVMVTRNPCSHPGDILKLRAVDIPEYAHLTDCIVFSVKGPRPSADMTSGGDLDGDKYFVTWDPEIIPPVMAQPAEYPGVKEPISFAAITDDDRAEYFARYTSASLGRIKNLYMKWARIEGPMSSQCQELNRLFSQCVDGNRVRVPERLEDAKDAKEDMPGFVLDVLHQASKAQIHGAHLFVAEFDTNTLETLDALLSRDQITVSEFDLVQLTLKWCERNGEMFLDYMPYFNFSALSDEQQAWLIGRLPVRKETPSLVRNSLLQSSLLTASELRPFKLDHARLHWRPIFDSSEDRMGRFLQATTRALETFHKKLILLKVDERLTLGVYVPKKLERASEAQVDAAIRVFAFPRSSDSDWAQHCVVPTKVNYRLYFDDHTFQLYNLKRSDTFVYLVKGQKNDASYRNTKSSGDKRRQLNATLQDGTNFECRASVALGKINSHVQKHVGRLNRVGIIGAVCFAVPYLNLAHRIQEIYTISNRDFRSMKLLDQWLHFIDTEEVLPLFKDDEKEYSRPTIDTLQLDNIPSTVRRVIERRDVSGLQILPSIAEIGQVLSLIISADDKPFLRQVYTHLLELAANGNCTVTAQALAVELLRTLPSAVYLTSAFLSSVAWRLHKDTLEVDFKLLGPRLLAELILLSDTMATITRHSFRLVLENLAYISLERLVELVGLIALTNSNPEVAMDLLLECVEPESSRLLVGRPVVVARFIKSLIGIALNHIDETRDSKATEGTFQLELDGEDEGYDSVKALIRIDSPMYSLLRTGDHIRLTVSQPPQNASFDQRYNMAAIVTKSEVGTAHFRCFHKVPSFLADATWKLTHCGSFVSSKAMLDAVSTFYTESAMCCRIFDLINPSSQNDGIVSGHRNLPYVWEQRLNESQNRAVATALAQPLTLLWGPPGTGKTFTIVAILIQLLQKLPKYRILLTAPTHNAVDNILSKYIASDGVQMTAIQPLRVSTDVNRVSPELRKYTCDAMVGKDLNSSFGALKKAAKRVKESRLVFTTCAGAGLGLLRKEEFEIVLVDEASQQTEPETLIPLVKGCHRAVLVGDHVQLRATVQQNATATGFDISLFERLYNAECGLGTKVMLDTQYRMHRDICDFSSREFYDGKLQTAVVDTSRPLGIGLFPWPEQRRKVFVQCAALEDIGQRSKLNKGQAQLCKRICELICSPRKGVTTPNDDAASTATAFTPAQIGILTPYTRQKELLKTMLPGYEVSSVDGFQGREAEIIIFVSTRCNLHRETGFLSDLRRLNVAATRARTGLIVIGDRATLTTTAISGDDVDESKRCWARLLEQCEQVEVLLDAV